MEGARTEFSMDKDNPVLQTFLSSNADLLHSLTADGRTAQVKYLAAKAQNAPAQSGNCCSPLQDVYDSAVEYFGENSKSTPPSVFFPVFVRFIKEYKVRETQNVVAHGPQACSTAHHLVFHMSGRKPSWRTSRG